MWDWKGGNRFWRSHNVSGCLANELMMDKTMPMLQNDDDVQESWVHGKTGACGFASPNTDLGF